MQKCPYVWVFFQKNYTRLSVLIPEVSVLPSGRGGKQNNQRGWPERNITRWRDLPVIIPYQTSLPWQLEKGTQVEQRFKMSLSGCAEAKRLGWNLSGKKKEAFSISAHKHERLAWWRRYSRSEKSYHPCSLVGILLVNRSIVARLMSADRNNSPKQMPRLHSAFVDVNIC